MLANILVGTFISVFIAIVALGHVLLITAIWPGLLGKGCEQRSDTVAGANQQLHLPN